MAITNRGAGIDGWLRSSMILGFLVVVVLVTQMMTASVARAASLGVDPSSGPPGSTVEVAGEGFMPLGSVRLCWDEDRCTNLGETRADPEGHIQVDVTIPDDAEAGGHSIHACQQGFGPGWSCDSVGFDVIVPTTTTTSTTTTTVPTTTSTSTPTTTTTTPPTTTTTQAPSTTSPPARTTPTGGGGTAPPETTNPPDTAGTENAPSSTTTSSTSATPTTTTGRGTSATTSDDEGFGILPGYRPPDDGPGSPGSDNPGGGEAGAVAGDDSEQAASGGDNEWVVAGLAVAVAGGTLWLADRVTKGDRRRYMLDLARDR